MSEKSIQLTQSSLGCCCVRECDLEFLPIVEGCSGTATGKICSFGGPDDGAFETPTEFCLERRTTITSALFEIGEPVDPDNTVSFGWVDAYDSHHVVEQDNSAICPDTTRTYFGSDVYRQQWLGEIPTPNEPGEQYVAYFENNFYDESVVTYESCSGAEGIHASVVAEVASEAITARGACTPDSPDLTMRLTGPEVTGDSFDFRDDFSAKAILWHITIPDFDCPGDQTWDVAWELGETVGGVWQQRRFSGSLELGPGETSITYAINPGPSDFNEPGLTVRTEAELENEPLCADPCTLPSSPHHHHHHHHP